MVSDKEVLEIEETSEAKLMVIVYNQQGEIIHKDDKVSIYCNGNIMTESSFKPSKIGDYLFEAECEGIKSNKITVTVIEKQILSRVEIMANKTEIEADGKDSTLFSVKGYTQNGQEKQLNNVVLYKNGEVFKEKSFATTEQGIYKFKAEADGIESREVDIVAVKPAPPVQIIINADKTEIMADGVSKVNLSVSCYNSKGEYIELAGVELYCNGEKIGSNEFTTDKVGIYVFKAVYEGVESNEKTVIAIEPFTVELSSDKNEMISDGKDKVILNVICRDKNGNEITVDGVGIYRDDVVYTAASTLTFSTEVPRVYTFKAYAKGVYSKTVSITAKRYTPKLTNIVLSADKTTIESNGTEYSQLTIKCYDEKGGLISDKIDLKLYGPQTTMVSNTTGYTFKTTTAGQYSFYVEKDGLISNTVIITANKIDKSLNYARKMLGKWEISVEGGVIKEYYTFDTVRIGSNGEYYASGYMTKIYSSTQGTYYLNESAVASYSKSTDKIGILCYWAGLESGSFHLFNFVSDNYISGDMALIDSGNITGTGKMNGIKTSSSYSSLNKINNIIQKETINKESFYSNFKKNSRKVKSTTNKYQIMENIRRMNELVK